MARSGVGCVEGIRCRTARPAFNELQNQSMFTSLARAMFLLLFHQLQRQMLEAGSPHGPSHQAMLLEGRVSNKFAATLEAAAGTTACRPSQHLLFLGRSRNRTFTLKRIVPTSGCRDSGWRADHD